MPKLLLLDGHSLAYRAFFALPTDLVTSSGTVTNAVYGFTAMLAKVLADERPDAIAVAFDAPGGSTERYELDPEYKAGRSETPDLFKAQWPLIHEVLDTLQITQLQVSGVEADDVIATLATRAAEAGTDVVIVTGDRDSFQLVRDPHITVLYNRRGVSDYARYDEAGIVERTGGVTPEQYVDYAALRGDSSDNLPGVPGIGEKTAAKLIVTYHDLEGIFDNLDKLPPKQRENLGNARDRVFKNRQMSRLRLDVDCGVDVGELRQGAFDKEQLRVLFNQLEFRTLLPRILDAIGDVAEAPEVEALEIAVEPIADAAAAAARLEELAGSDARVALEARWSGVPGRSGVLGLALASSATPDGSTDRAQYIHGDLLDEALVRVALERLATSSSARVVAHRAKELMHGLGALDIVALEHDTAVMAYLVDPGEGKYLLDDLAPRYMGVELTSPDASDAGQLDFGGDAELDRTGRAAVVVLRLADALASALEARELLDLYRRFELPLISVLMKMEAAGVRIDVAFLNELGRELAEQAKQHEATIHELAGEPFLINSVPQLRTVLFDKLGLTPVKKTKTGPSTDADSLQKMADAHPIVAEILKYREVDKLRSTYTDALPPLVAADGRIHATFNQLVATTGRISSEAPNLQNIPVRSATGREMRRAFVADAGHELLTADYSQIELRVLAHVAEDPGLIDAFDRGADVHTATAAKVYGVEESDVDAFQRRFAKVVNYGLAYGMEAYGLGQRLDIPTEEARQILDAYFAGFPRVAEYMKRTVAEAKARGYTTTMFGRRRQLPELSSDNFRIRQMGERMAQNAPVQGAAADIFKLAMIAVDRALEAGGFATRMILTVHDELVFEVPDGEADAVTPVVKDTMESVCELRVPLVVDLAHGRTWADCK
jgi:DNA polymerase-1